LDELRTIHKHIQKLSSRVSDWRKKYKKYMNENKYPSLKYLQQLLNMTEKFPYTIKEIHTLKNYLKIVNVWVEEANILLLRDKRNVNKENLKPRSLNQIKTLIEKADAYAFESSEIKTLKSLYEAVISFQVTVTSFFKSAETDKASLNEVKELVKEGRELDVDIPEMKKLELLYENLIWKKESELIIVDGEIEADYATVTKLIDMAKECKIPEDNKVYQDLLKEKEKADNWKARAEKLMAKPEIELKELESLLDEINDIPNIEGLMEDLHDMRVKAEDYIEMAKMYLDEENEEEEEEVVEEPVQRQKQESEQKIKQEVEEKKKAMEGEERGVLTNINSIEKKDNTTPSTIVKNEQSESVDTDTQGTIKIKKEIDDVHDNNENTSIPMKSTVMTTNEDTDNDLCRHFNDDAEEDEETLYEDSMDLDKEDYQKIKKNKERIISKQNEASKFDLKFILNNSSSHLSNENDKDKALNIEVNNLVYNSICGAVGEIKKEPLIDLANTQSIQSESGPNVNQLKYELPVRAIDIELWKEKYGLDENYNIKELKKSGSRKKNDKKNKKKKVILTMQDFEDFIDTLNTHKVKINIQKLLLQQHQKIEDLFVKGLNFFDSSKNNTTTTTKKFSEKLEEVFENIENCIQTLNLRHNNEDEMSSSQSQFGHGNRKCKEDTKSKISSRHSNNTVKSAYCFCRTNGEGFMVACDICNEWYHGQW